jgi:ABC-type antimicrobial peptide transport system permease subunit
MSSEMMYLAVKTADDPMRHVAAVRGALERVDPAQAVFDVSTMEQIIAGSLAQRRFQTTLLGLFGAVSLVLAALGTYGVISYEAGRRTREIGIRIALGALPWRVQWMVIRQGMAPAMLGVVVGLALTVGASRLLETLVYGITTTDLSTYLGTALVLSAVALLACALPARAAGRVEPMVAMRTLQ